MVAEPVGARSATREPIPARLVVAADGRASVVVERLGLRRPHRWLRRLALVADVEGARGTVTAARSSSCRPAYAILNPVTPSIANLSLVGPIDDGRRHRRDLAGYFDAATRTLPGLGERLRVARRVGPVRAMGPLAYDVVAPRDDGVVLVGDAAGFLDPFTGEGVYAALRSAEIAAPVAAQAIRDSDVSAGALRSAHQRRAAEFSGKVRVTLLLQRLLARRALLVAAARLLARRPAHLARLMGVFGDFVPPGALLEPAFLAGLLPRLPPSLARARVAR